MKLFLVFVRFKRWQTKCRLRWSLTWWWLDHSKTSQFSVFFLTCCLHFFSPNLSPKTCHWLYFCTFESALYFYFSLTHCCKSFFVLYGSFIASAHLMHRLTNWFTDDLRCVTSGLRDSGVFANFLILSNFLRGILLRMFDLGEEDVFCVAKPCFQSA